MANIYVYSDGEVQKEFYDLREVWYVPHKDALVIAVGGEDKSEEVLSLIADKLRDTYPGLKDLSIFAVIRSWDQIEKVVNKLTSDCKFGVEAWDTHEILDWFWK